MYAYALEYAGNKQTIPKDKRILSRLPISTGKRSKDLAEFQWEFALENSQIISMQNSRIEFAKQFLWQLFYEL